MTNYSLSTVASTILNEEHSAMEGTTINNHWSQLATVYVCKEIERWKIDRSFPGIYWFLSTYSFVLDNWYILNSLKFYLKMYILHCVYQAQIRTLVFCLFCGVCMYVCFKYNLIKHISII